MWWPRICDRSLIETLFRPGGWLSGGFLRRLHYNHCKITFYYQCYIEAKGVATSSGPFERYSNDDQGFLLPAPQHRDHETRSSHSASCLRTNRYAQHLCCIRMRLAGVLALSTKSTTFVLTEIAISGWKSHLTHASNPRGFACPSGANPTRLSNHQYQPLQVRPFPR